MASRASPPVHKTHDSTLKHLVKKMSILDDFCHSDFVSKQEHSLSSHQPPNYNKQRPVFPSAGTNIPTAPRIHSRSCDTTTEKNRGMEANGGLD